MSRVADAIRKYRGLGVDPLDRAAQRDADSPSWIAAKIPWDLDDPPAPTNPRASLPELPSLELDSTPDVRYACTKSVLDIECGTREQLAHIAQRMLQPGPTDTRIRSLLFTAVGPEQSARVCAATADALAEQTTGSVCLVDGNLHAPSLNTLVGVNGMPGVSDLLLQGGDLRSFLARLTANLWLLPGGTRCAEAVPVLVGEQMRRHVRDVLATFDYVLMNTSAASARSDAVALGKLVDAVVLAIGANATRREVAKRTLEQFRVANVRILGAILTNRDFPIPERLYRLL